MMPKLQKDFLWLLLYMKESIAQCRGSVLDEKTVTSSHPFTVKYTLCSEHMHTVVCEFLGVIVSVLRMLVTHIHLTGCVTLKIAPQFYSNPL